MFDVCCTIVITTKITKESFLEHKTMNIKSVIIIVAHLRNNLDFNLKFAKLDLLLISLNVYTDSISASRQE